MWVLIADSRAGNFNDGNRYPEGSLFMDCQGSELKDLETLAVNGMAKESEKYHLLTGKDYTVGRKGCEILVPNDQSISRRHATFHVSHPETNISHPHKPPTLTVTDTSKLGTKVGETLVKGKEKQVKTGDIITFGTAGLTKYRAVYEPLICTTSCLDSASKRSTKQLMARLGGHVVSDWRKECQVLVMSSLSVTVKVICALVSLKPVVSVQYLEDLVQSYENRSEEPKPDTYVPTLAASQLNPTEVSFKVDASRKSLFQGKIFIFLSPKQFKKLCLAVELAGGTPMLMEEGTDDNEDDIIIGDNACVMQCDADESTQTMSQNARDWHHYVRDLLKRYGKRMISDSELGYSVLYCSIERYCNPDKKLVTEGTVASQSLSQIVPQTVPDSAEVGSMDTECTTIGLDRARQTSGPSVVPETESLHHLHSRSGFVSPSNGINVPPTVETASLAEESCDVLPDNSRKRRPDETDTLPQQKQARIEDTQSLTVSSVPIFKQDIETPKKVISSTLDEDTCKAMLASGVVKKAEAAVSQDSPAPGPTAIPESQTYSPGEQKHENNVGSKCGNPPQKHENNVGSNSANAPPLIKVETEDSPMINTKAPSKDDYKDVPLGFLCARVNEPLRVSKYVKDEGVPCNLMVTMETSLVVTRNNRSVRTRNTDANMWKGKEVKNFKRFRKVSPAGSSGLPVIIGRSDMEVHQNNTREVDDVFNQELQVESQQRDANRLADELFQWNPSKKGRW